jgi:hypothetical protein
MVVCVVCPFEEYTQRGEFCLLFWTGKDSYVESNLKCRLVDFAVLTDDVICYIFPFISLDCIILFDVVTELSLKRFHIV